ncbi:isocitrate/isopropylmalate dehydrogenase family protein [Candidatus Microgenomates bacterium]|nr:MAG: isocitrate/isopropylmalate dehydrogenase family protein [Candidatus Microgenomates bacterium]
MRKTKYTICIIGGDGVGPELMEETHRLLSGISNQFIFSKANAGFAYFEKNGVSLPDETLECINQADAILFGAVTTPPNIENYQSPILAIRQKFNLYANVRPIISLPISNSRPNIDFVIVRENTEDLYSGREHAITGGFVAERVITKKACEGIIRFAFEKAKQEKRTLVTAVHKANVLRKTDGLFLEVFQSIAKEYPGISTEDVLVDSAAMRIIKEPEHFQIIVTTNMFGDILSDEAIMLVGGLGVGASANIGEKKALFEPIHGSAPKYAGKNTANPVASFLAASMMLEYLAEQELAQKIRNAVTLLLKQRETTKDLGGTLTTTQFTDRVINTLHT